MENISPDDLALELLNQCLRGNSYSSELLQVLLRFALSADPLQARRASQSLFRIVVERLGDLFEPCLADCYAALFSEAISYALPDLSQEEILGRFRRTRVPRRFRGPDPKRVFVLSRITLGADVAISSIVMDAAKKRFPCSQIIFVSPHKNYELFEADPRIAHLEAPYVREGSLADRLSVFPALREALWDKDAIVIDPDSRLTQLGLLPVCPEENYFFFESRSYGEYGDDSLGSLTRRWVSETFEISDSKAYLSPVGDAGTADITVSFGVGENPAKKIADPFERETLLALSKMGSVLIDRGASVEESARVDASSRGLDTVQSFTGRFADFAGSIAKSRLYMGYDSAAQHVAAAAGVTLITVFSGYASQRFCSRWRPDGEGGIHIFFAEHLSPEEILTKVLQVLQWL